MSRTDADARTFQPELHGPGQAHPPMPSRPQRLQKNPFTVRSRFDRVAESAIRRRA